MEMISILIMKLNILVLMASEMHKNLRTWFFAEKLAFLIEKPGFFTDKVAFSIDEVVSMWVVWVEVGGWNRSRRKTRFFV